MPVIFYSGFDAGELRRYEKRFKDCERFLTNQKEDDLRKQSFVKEIATRESSLAASSNAFFKKDTLNVLREQTFSSHSVSLRYNSGDVPLKAAQPVSAEHSQRKEGALRENMMCSKPNEGLWIASNKDLRKFLRGLMHM